MKSRKTKLTFKLLAFFLPPVALCIQAFAQASTFTYQGRLNDGTNPATGSYDFRFRLASDPQGSNYVGSLVVTNGLAVTGGLFTASLDFGSVFTGSNYWLEVDVRTNGATSYSALVPLQALTPVPYALYAMTPAGPAGAPGTAGATGQQGPSGASPFSLAGTNAFYVEGFVGIGLTNPATSLDVKGVVSATSFSGNGAGLTQLNGGAIANGSVGATQLADGAAVANLAASGQSGVPSGGLVLSTMENNPALISAGYVKIGTIQGGDTWLRRGDGAPAPRAYHTAVWTGSEMIVWGGYNGSYFNDGGRYNPTSNSWTSLDSASGTPPSQRAYHTAVWTGSEMIVWGGYNGSYLSDGGRYNPTSNSWTSLDSASGTSPSQRAYHTAVWTSREMIVWGGRDSGSFLNDGGRYNSAANGWTSLASASGTPPSGREYHTAVWTGSEMIVWGGFIPTGSPIGTYFDDGGIYTPVSDIWGAVSTTGSPFGRYQHTAVWTGGEMIVWGGASGKYLSDGSRYNPGSNTWMTVTTNNAPSARYQHSAVWTGSEMIVWGGWSGNSGYLNDDARYNPAANSWTAVATIGAPVARKNHTAIWTGREMIVWGGIGSAGYFNDTWSYTPGQVMFLYQKM